MSVFFSCSRAGLNDEGSRYFDRRKEKYNLAARPRTLLLRGGYLRSGLKLVNLLILSGCASGRLQNP